MGSYGLEKPIELQGVTAQLSHWISGLKLSDVPPAVLERAKYQLLDGVACALVGAHVPWSEKYVETTAEYEPPGGYSVIGWDKVPKLCIRSIVIASDLAELKIVLFRNLARWLRP